MGSKKKTRKSKRKQQKKNKLIIAIVALIAMILIIMLVNKNSKTKIASTVALNDEVEKEVIGNVLMVDISEEELWEQIDQMPESKEAEKTDNNEKSNQAKNKYYIKVNVTANTVTIYENDGEGNYKPIKAMVCSTGGATPQSGTNTIGARYVWLPLFGDVYGHYCTRIGTTHILFHSVPYLENYNSGSLEYWEFDKLGTSASMGCIRLQIKDTKWIYDNIPKGTVVEFYKDSNPGPLGKPSTPKISSNTDCRNWDPTDTDSSNPWLNNNNNKPKENVSENNNQANNQTNNSNNSNVTTNENNNTNQINNNDNNTIQQNNTVEVNEIINENLTNDQLTDLNHVTENDALTEL